MSGELGMPKWASRVWPYEEGMQPRFWEREEEFTVQNVKTSLAREVAAHETIADIEKTMGSELYRKDQIDVVNLILVGYHNRLKEIYTAHRKAIRSIKDRYPSVR